MQPRGRQGGCQGWSRKDRSFLWLEEASLDPRDLCVALPIAAAAAGVELVEDTEVLGVTCQARSVAVKTQKGMMSAGSFVNCCGAWAGKVQPAASAAEPWKGQMHHGPTAGRARAALCFAYA